MLIITWGRIHLVFVVHATFIFAFAFSGFSTDFFVVLFESSKILTSFGELTFLHTFTDVPVNECALGVHKIELVVDAGENFSDSSGVGNHADCAHDTSEVATWDNGRRLVVDSALETGRAPVHELDGTLGLDGSNSGVDILRNNIPAEHKAACHVLSVTRVALGHHGRRFEGGVGDLGNGQLFVVCLLSGDDRGVRRKHKVNTRVWHQVGLELSDVDVERTVETEGSGQGRDGLSHQPVKVGVGRALDVEVATADVVDGFVVQHDGDVGVLEEGVGGQDGVVRFDNSGGHLRGRVDGESELGLAAVVDGQTFQDEGSETGTGTSTDGVEDEESLQTGAVVGELADAVEDEVNNFLSDGVVTTGVVVGSIFLAGDQLFGVVQLTVGSGADFVDDSGFQVNEDSAGDVLASTSLGEEGVESVVATTDGLVGRHLAIWLDAVLEAIKLPAGVSGLDTALSDVKRDDFAHFEGLLGGLKKKKGF